MPVIDVWSVLSDPDIPQDVGQRLLTRQRAHGLGIDPEPCPEADKPHLAKHVVGELPASDEHEADECGAVSPHGDVCVRLKEHTGLCQSGVGRLHVSSPGQAGKPWRWYGTAPASPVSGVPAGTPGDTQTLASRDSVRE